MPTTIIRVKNNNFTIALHPHHTHKTIASIPPFFIPHTIIYVLVNVLSYM